MKIIIKNCLIVFLVLAGSILLILENQIGGFRAFVVTSGSMEPAIATGSLVITQYTYPHQLRPQDIITFIPPTKERAFVTHRIVKATPQETLATFITKGDNNKNEDPWVLAGGAVVGKVLYIVPYVGYGISFIQSKLGLILFILLPAVYIIINEIGKIISTIKSHKEKPVLSQNPL